VRNFKLLDIAIEVFWSYMLPPRYVNWWRLSCVTRVCIMFLYRAWLIEANSKSIQHSLSENPPIHYRDLLSAYAPTNWSAFLLLHPLVAGRRFGYQYVGKAPTALQSQCRMSGTWMDRHYHCNNPYDPNINRNRQPYPRDILHRYSVSIDNTRQQTRLGRGRWLRESQLPDSKWIIMPA